MLQWVGMAMRGRRLGTRDYRLRAAKGAKGKGNPPRERRTLSKADGGRKQKPGWKPVISLEEGESKTIISLQHGDENAFVYGKRMVVDTDGVGLIIHGSPVQYCLVA